MARFVRIRSKLIAAALLTAVIALPRPASREAALTVTAVRFWTFHDVTRIAIEITGEFSYLSDRVPDPDRLYFDIIDARSLLTARGVRTIPVGDSRVRQIRVAQTQLSVTRIVLDLEDSVEATASQLSSPDRLIIEVRSKGAAPNPVQPPEPPVQRMFIAPRQPDLVLHRADPLPMPPPVETAGVTGARISLPPVRMLPPPRHARSRPAEPPVRETASAGSGLRELVRTPLAGDLVGRAASKNSDGERSMTRVLGLKIGRIVIDAGHGGHDTGTSGRNGLQEKDLVLDVSRRLGKLVTERMGSEVIFTRSDDTFIPLEMRTAIANEKRADLFLSVHANSSPIRTTAGVETFYLNFSTSRSDLDVAARENASSQKTVYELKDLLQRIALQDKVEESKEFAERIQAAMYTLSSRNNAKQRNRGVKKAPFVVLIGAQMPSILAEIGFVSNPREEALMLRPDHRQKIAEALYKGLAKYAGTLSHFQLAQISGE